MSIGYQSLTLFTTLILLLFLFPPKPVKIIFAWRPYRYWVARPGFRDIGYPGHRTKGTLWSDWHELWRGGAGCVGRSLIGQKIVGLDFASSFKNIFECDCWPTRHSCGVQKQAWSAVVLVFLDVSYLINPGWEKQKQREIKQFQPTAWPRNNRYSVAYYITIENQRHSTVSWKER